MTMLTVVLMLSALGGTIFLAGLVRGSRAAIRDADKTSEDDPFVEDKGYAWIAAVAVSASTAVIALAGLHPAFTYLGPLLAIGTATGIGVAFLVGDRKR